MYLAAATVGIAVVSRVRTYFLNSTNYILFNNNMFGIKFFLLLLSFSTRSSRLTNIILPACVCVCPHDKILGG